MAAHRAELRDEARSKNMKSAETYMKACRSLAACPVKYERPRDLVCLQGIGPKIVAVLEKKWKGWCEENGVEVAKTPASGLAIFLLTVTAGDRLCENAVLYMVISSSRTSTEGQASVVCDIQPTPLPSNPGVVSPYHDVTKLTRRTASCLTLGISHFTRPTRKETSLQTAEDVHPSPRFRRIRDSFSTDPRHRFPADQHSGVPHQVGVDSRRAAIL